MKPIEHSLRSEIFAYAKNKYGTQPEYLWASAPDYAVLRHNDNNKWYGLIMNITYEKIDPQKTGAVDVLNVKLDDILFRDLLIQQDGYYIGYHISRGNWISIALDGTVELESICSLLDTSFTVTASRQKKNLIRPPKEWLVPANPKYYDIEHAFDDEDTIEWKQNSGAKKGDTVFLYVGAPVSAILYKCIVTQTDIPCDYQSDNLTITKVMTIKLIRRYKRDDFTFQRLKNEYGIFAVRSARSVPNSLSNALQGDKYE